MPNMSAAAASGEFLLYRRSVAIDVSSTDQTLAEYGDAILITTTGNLVVRLIGDTTDTALTSVAANAILPLQVKQITRSGTTAVGKILYVK